MMSDYAVVIAARMLSTRLPNKALVSYSSDGTPNLAQIIDRWRRHSRRQPTVIVTTTTDKDDDPIESIAQGCGVPCSRGHPTDVVAQMDVALQRYAPGARWIARGLADNPLVDVPLADWRMDVLAETGADGVWYGLDHERITYCGTTDVWSRSAWDTVVAESTGDEREHPGLFYWRRLSRFQVVQLPLPMREYLQPIRTELDTQDDLKLFREVWSAWHSLLNLYDFRPVDTLWALSYLMNHPEVVAINAEMTAKTQTHPHWPKGMGWLCDSCRGRLGSVVAGDLEIRCSHCGKARKFYSHKPKPSTLRY